jgi:hypothetical protein
VQAKDAENQGRGRNWKRRVSGELRLAQLERRLGMDSTDSGMPDFATFKRCRLSAKPLTAGPRLLHAGRGGRNRQVTVTDGQRIQSPS